MNIKPISLAYINMKCDVQDDTVLGQDGITYAWQTAAS